MPGTTSKPDVLEQLQLLEEQLSAIESTARTVEGEFKSSNQVREKNCICVVAYVWGCLGRAGGWGERSKRSEGGKGEEARIVQRREEIHLG